MHIYSIFNLSIRTLTKHEKIYLISITAICGIVLILIPIFIVKSLPLASAQTAAITSNNIQYFHQILCHII
jgi:hypothetical protein